MKNKLFAAIIISSISLVGCVSVEQEEKEKQEFKCSHNVVCQNIKEHDELIKLENKDDKFTSQELKEDKNTSKHTHYRVIVGSFKEKENADKIVKDLKSEEIDAFVGSYLIENETHHRVVVGSFKDKDNADSLVKKIKDLGYDAFITTYHK